jgi:uncharacterized protein
MIAVDTNILVHAHRRDGQWHDAAAIIVKSLAEGSALWAIPWPCMHEFISVVTHRKIYQPASTLAQAFNQIEQWCMSPKLKLLGESNSHIKTLAQLSHAANISGAMVHDARIAAICLDHGVSELWSADRDFSRFPQIKVKNPLIST